MAGHVIELKNVTYSIMEANKERILLDNINYSFEKGTISTVSGPSGSGKTTLLYAIAGLLDNVQGEINVAGSVINRMSTRERDLYRLKNISIIFQNLNLFSFMNVEDNILVPFYLKEKVITDSIRSKVSKYLDLMNLGQIHKKSINVLSGGEQQRIAIIRALIDDPKVILCDEPTASLDEKNVKIFMDTLVKIKKETNTTFIIVTHDDRVYKYGEKKFNIMDGKLIESL